MPPVRSMTGFGAARREAAGAVAEVEARSVNNRHLSVTIRAPSAFDSRQSELESLVRARLQRGTVTVSISVRTPRVSAPARINASVVADYVRQLAEAGLPTSSEVIGQILRLPGAVEDAPPTEFGDEEFVLAKDAVDAAISALLEMREREGAALSADLDAGAVEIERVSALIAARVPASVEAAKTKLEERLAALLADTALAPELVAREVAVLADRTDVAEELARLSSHVAQWRGALSEGGPVGRRLEFLAQELGREANTIGSKSQDDAIARAVVELKIAIERLKEQAANAE